eukprot:166410-Prymnesium_polylepis.1
MCIPFVRTTHATSLPSQEQDGNKVRFKSVILSRYSWRLKTSNASQVCSGHVPRLKMVASQNGRE